jgi:glycerol 2-dehydrogenase (NADP+)
VEAEVGEAIRLSGIPREDIFVVSKYWGTHHGRPAEALEISLKALGLDYLDLFLMHWPTSAAIDGSAQAYPGDPPYWTAWKNLETVVGPKCKSIGVCNFTQKTLSRLLQDASIPPSVHQFELHPLNPCLRLVPWCQEKGIHVMGYSSLGSERHARLENPVLTDPTVTEIASRMSCTPASVVLSWAVQRGVTVVPKTVQNKRLDENIRLLELSEADSKKINEVHINSGTMRLADVTKGLLRETPEGGFTILGWTPEDFGWEDEAGNWLT